MHVQQNGAASGDLACFYAIASSPAVAGDAGAVYCFHTAALHWLPPVACSTPHQGGAIVAVGTSILVAGGFDPNPHASTKATAVIDVISVSALI